MIFSQFLCTKLPKNKKRSILQETCCSRSLRNSITTDSIANFSGDNRLFDRSVHYRLLIPTSHITHTSWILFGRAEGKFTKILQNFPRMPDFSKRFPHIAQQGEYWQRHLATIFQTAQTRGTIEALLYSAWTMNVGLDTYMSCASFPFTAESTAEFRNKCSVRNKGSAWFQIGIPWCNPTTKPESGGAFFFFFFAARFFDFKESRLCATHIVPPRRSGHLLMDKPATLSQVMLGADDGHSTEEGWPKCLRWMWTSGVWKWTKICVKTMIFSQEATLNYIYTLFRSHLIQRGTLQKSFCL